MTALEKMVDFFDTSYPRHNQPFILLKLLAGDRAGARESSDSRQREKEKEARRA